jgi:hypothetical protein
MLQVCVKVRNIENDLVFLVDGRPSNSESIKSRWRKACKAIGLVDLRPGSMILAVRGVPTREDQGWTPGLLRVSWATGAVSGRSTNGEVG